MTKIHYIGRELSKNNKSIILKKKLGKNTERVLILSSSRAD